MDNMDSQSGTLFLTKDLVGEFLDSVDTFLFDCDGVLWRSSELIEGVPETLKWLRSQGKRIIFVTNNSTTSRLNYVKKITSLGIECCKEEIFCSAYAVSLYLQEKNFNKKAYVIGMSGMAQELEEAGISFRGVDEHSTFDLTLSDAGKIEHDPEIGAVLVGFDIRICYYKLAFAKRHLDNPDCIFVATNTDSSFPGEGGVLIPGGGSIVKMIECASDRKSTVVGKPSQWFLNKIIDELSLDRSRTVMVGDRLDTDILFGVEGQLKTLLVLSGVTTKNDLTDTTITPQYVLPTISELFYYSNSQ